MICANLPPALRAVPRAIAVALVVVLTPRSASRYPWKLYSLRDGAYVQVGGPRISVRGTSEPSPVAPPIPDSSWRVTAASLADATGDGNPEWVLLVWRPWRDWPIQRWISAPSPIAGFHDAEGYSCHLILLDPADGREIWAGSALPVPLLDLDVGDVDGDGQNEVVTLEGDYATGRDGAASRVNVWAWQGFGFGLDWRSELSTFHELRLTDDPQSGILSIAVR